MVLEDMDMNKKIYNEVEIEIVYLDLQNVMAISGEGFGVDDNEWFNDNF